MLTITNKNGVFYANDEDANISEDELTVQNNGWCKLPEGNSSNRTWIKATELEKIDGTKELPYREKSVRATSGVAGKTWIDFLSDEDKAIYEQLKAKGEQARLDAKKKPLTEEEKAERNIAKLEAKLAELKDKRDSRKKVEA